MNVSNNAGVTPLDRAKRIGQTEIVELLNKHGAKESQKNEQSIEMTINSNNLEKVKEMIAQGVKLDVRDSRGNTPLIQAIIQGKMSFVETLISGGADVNAKNRRGGTPLHIAARRGPKEVVELLIANGADVNAKDNNGDTPLSLALSGNHQEVIDLLKKHGAKE